LVSFTVVPLIPCTGSLNVAVTFTPTATAVVFAAGVRRVTVGALGSPAVKVAFTDWAALMETVQVVAVPEHPPPLQPPNEDPLAAAAVRVTDVPVAKVAEQVVPQLMPAGALVTVPDPVPDFVTVNC
jgi:hypothetical protein